MKYPILYVLPIAAALVLPGLAQQAPADSQQPTAASQSAAQAASSSDQAASSSDNVQPGASDEQNLSARQPLQAETHEGFWGKLNPFARKKYVQRQIGPVRNRVNELDELTAANAKSIKDVDARAQEGIRQASAKANEADQNAVEAGNRAQQANQTAQQAGSRLNNVEQVVGNIDQYQAASRTEIRFRPGQTTLSAKDKAVLDDMAAVVAGKKGYIIEVQGFSALRGQAGIQNSQAMANSVVRHLVERHDIPMYRIFVIGMGNAPVQPAPDASASSSSGAGSTAATAKPHGSRVEVSLLKNSLDQLASNGSAQPAASTNPPQPQQR